MTLPYPAPTPANEPVLDYRPGSAEREALLRTTGEMLASPVEIPLLIGGKEVRTGRTAQAVCPHAHGHVLATYHTAGPEEVAAAVTASQEAWNDWSRLAPEARMAVFLKAAELLAGPWRQICNGSTVLNQSKTCHQAEIDAACELIDFWRFNVAYADQIYREQPLSVRGVWNYVDHRPLEGFVFAVTPFNFTSIAGNLPTAPALMGNVVLWKPASSAVHSGYQVMRLLEAAGLPPGVINYLPGRGGEVGGPVLDRPELAGIHFTGSTGTFQAMWRTVGEGIQRYRSYPRIVGETGGKDFIFVHESADLVEVATACVRGGFEYQGQKCSAPSRVYVPRSRWPQLREMLVAQIGEIQMGDPREFSNFMAAVIDRASFETIQGYIEHARSTPEHTIVAGGGCNAETGYFIQPTLVESTDPRSRLMSEEIFGPVVTVHPYDESDLEGALRLCNETSPYALTGAVFGRDRQVLARMSQALRFAAGNFYINDKPTGAVVGQQPFGGARASGTNDKAGSPLNLLRWTSQRTVKETFLPPRDFRYPYMA